MHRQALIVGGGIGGLCAAICLRLTGWDVQVFEQLALGCKSAPMGLKFSNISA
ncbi:NAD(P)-binding protein [Planktomarina temperata]|nr:NAD(P)-binding protein [Planktomarina temperata]